MSNIITGNIVALNNAISSIKKPSTEFTVRVASDGAISDLPRAKYTVTIAPIKIESKQPFLPENTKSLEIRSAVRTAELAAKTSVDVRDELPQIFLKSIEKFSEKPSKTTETLDMEATIRTLFLGDENTTPYKRESEDGKRIVRDLLIDAKGKLLHPNSKDWAFKITLEASVDDGKVGLIEICDDEVSMNKKMTSIRSIDEALDELDRLGVYEVIGDINQSIDGTVFNTALTVASIAASFRSGSVNGATEEISDIYSEIKNDTVLNEDNVAVILTEEGLDASQFGGDDIISELRQKRITTAGQFRQLIAGLK